ncbi:DUF3187 family protein [Steroidobacter sp. S1-65]|uniref:DUF3187 family protein n=1 Tax=Steroidobacter gossypii TaxID=2805490 RepID=A0ABS1WQU3_9GAMM|nr:DUF3187 family protein [Steroidobacter gossypii]MBM0103345.1 DUF3187 family protein [Steroidobacter gossypii]
MRRWLALLVICATSSAAAADRSDWHHPGLLRGRDLTPFGLFRLDMLPAHTVDARQDSWAVEVLTAYQNTFVMSDNVRDYLEARDVGRQPLSQADAAAILNMPGDAYYVDGEIGLIDVIFHKRLSTWWTTYLSIPYIGYGRGVLDSTIEEFHDASGFSQQGRDLVARNQFQMVYNVRGARYSQLAQSEGGFSDPVLGIRYSLPEPRYGWDVVFEVAAKIAVDSKRVLLSTGRDDYGTQLTLQRTWGRHAAYIAGSAVYYAGGPETPADEHQIIPTALFGYGFGITPNTTAILQAYASRSTVRDAEDLEELTDNKYQLSVGLQQRVGHVQWSLAVTENISNFSNTPDIGAQLGLAYLPIGPR